MRTTTPRINVIAILALAALFSVCPLSADPSPSINRWVFLHTSAGVVGTVEGEAAEMWFHANVQVFDNGKATGTIQVRVVGGASFLYRVVLGEATFNDVTVGEVILILERVGEDGAPTGETDLAIVRPSSTIQDCLIYDFLGPTIHFETAGILGFRHEHTRPE